MAIQSITTEALQETLTAGTTDTVLDVREVDEYEDGHIKDAVNFPLSAMMDQYESLNKDEHYYVICKKGGRSLKASTFLHDQGFEVTNIEGGMDDWKGEIVY